MTYSSEHISDKDIGWHGISEKDIGAESQERRKLTINRHFGMCDRRFSDWIHCIARTPNG